jgi:hypothetical protein
MAARFRYVSTTPARCIAVPKGSRSPKYPWWTPNRMTWPSVRATFLTTCSEALARPSPLQMAV